MDSGKDLVEVLRDGMKILEGQLAILQLAIAEDVVDQATDHSLYSRGGGIPQGPAGRLHNIGQHNQTGLLGLGLGAWIPIIVNVDRRQYSAAAGLLPFPCFQGFLIEKGNEACSMMLADDVDDGLGKMMLSRQFDSLFDMRDKDEAAHGRGQLLVAIFAFHLVFNII